MTSKSDQIRAMREAAANGGKAPRAAKPAPPPAPPKKPSKRPAKPKKRGK